jgi:hypothetical protein
MKQGYRIISIEAANIYRQEQENGVLKFLKNRKEETYDEKAITELIQRKNNVDEILFSMLNA